jgi:hypothetical protein
VSDLASSPYICLINAKRRKTISGHLEFAELFSAESSVLLIPLIRICTGCIMKPASVGLTHLHKTDKIGKRKEGRKKYKLNEGSWERHNAKRGRKEHEK